MRVVWMWELDHKEGWAPNNWFFLYFFSFIFFYFLTLQYCIGFATYQHESTTGFWTVVLEKTLRVPLDCKEIKPDNPKGNQSWIFIGRTDAEAETPILWPPDAKIWLIGNDHKAGKDWRQEEKGRNRGWDGWMASPTRWIWVWASSGRWWRTGKPGVLQSMGFQRVGHNWAIEQQQQYMYHIFTYAWTLKNGTNELIYKTEIDL